MITNHFEIPVVQNLETFSFFCTGIYSLFRSICKIHDNKNIWSTSSFISRICWHQSKVYIFQKCMKTFMIKRQPRTALSWSFILMLLMTTDKFSEFNRICIDQGLNLVFESLEILHGVPPDSSMVFTCGIDIVSSWIWRFSRLYGDNRNSIILDQYGE